jgi:hypothetical protein
MAINIRNIKNESRSEEAAKVSQNNSNVVNKTSEARQIVNEKQSTQFNR